MGGKLPKRIISIVSRRDRAHAVGGYLREGGRVGAAEKSIFLHKRAVLLARELWRAG